MTAELSVRAYTGTDAGTESAALDDVVLISEDAVTGANVAPGTVSYERWLRLRVDTAPTTGVAAFWMQSTGALPDGVSILFGIADDPATPVNTVSSVATKTLSSGQRYWFDMGTLTEVGDTTRYVILQEVVASDAASGAIPEQSFKWGWVER